MMGFVYFAQRSPWDGPIKIGFSRNVPKRLRALRSQIQDQVFLLALAPGSFDKERKLHKRFSKFALGGEWFSCAPELVEFIAKQESAEAWSVRRKRHYYWSRSIDMLKPNN